MFKGGQRLFRSVSRCFCGRNNGVKLKTFNNVLKNQMNFTTASAMSDKFKLPARLGTGEKSVWVEYIQLVIDYKPKVNLGQGFPDYHPPCYVTNNLAAAACDKNPLLNQYCRGFGLPRLVTALSKLYSPLVCQKINPQTQVLVTIGAYESLFCTILGHVDKGDEVIVIEPYFDCYEPMIIFAGGKPRFIPLRPQPSCGEPTSENWVLDCKELESLFNCNTKMIILNSPHNPTGKVFTMDELELIACLCQKFNVLCLADEVYEWLVFEPKKHIRMSTIPGMWERTISIGSAGKTFSVTGWKTGWAYGPEKLMKNLMTVHQNVVYTGITPIEEAIARSLEFELSRRDTPEYYLTALAREILPKRNFLARSLKANGFTPHIPDSGYFMMADFTKLKNKIDLSKEPDKYLDYKFTKKWAKETSVLTIPPSAFYSKNSKCLGENFARFCFIKKDEKLLLADKLMKEWNKNRKKK
ncbi:unnamed protein product [Chrysodeixis includens]|uniref:Aminotransferase class I/classII large domain-containing protein n=1 Tax=Chrysodeixis includens TaxID=689277 RepID=A0A9P0BZB1_CHRIL|nr:unnamed protein product [Chrysodeixis includens]